MIYKELDPFERSKADRFELAGRKAEEQMAFYLKRFFGSSAEVDVLNYLRIQLGGEAAQMDHLLLMPHGLLIVESKSVSGEVVIGDSGQWVRRWSGRQKGMPSPVTQARMQGMLLKDLLLQGITASQREVMARLDVDVLVAISDEGVIRWPTSGPLPEVCKADQVPDRVKARMKQSAAEHAGRPLILNEKNRKTIADFLVRKHQPLRGSTTEATAATAAKPVATAVRAAERHTQYEASTALLAERPGTDALPARACRTCHSCEVSVEHGRYGYFLKCKACEGNTPLKFKCPSCGQEGKLRKAGREFFAECRHCDASQLFYTNPSDSQPQQ